MIPADRINGVGRNVAEHLPDAEQRRQFQQLHLDGRPRDEGQRLLGSCRPPLLWQRLVLRPVQLRQVQPRCAAGPGRVLPANAGRGRRAFRSRTVRRRNSEHAVDYPRRRLQLLESRHASHRQRVPRRLRPNVSIDVPVRLWHRRRRVARHQRHQRQRDYERATEHQRSRHDGDFGRPGVSTRQPQAVPLAARGHGGVAEGRSQPEVRLSARRSLCFSVHPYRHARQHQLRPQLHQQPGQQRRRLRDSRRY